MFAQRQGVLTAGLCHGFQARLDVAQFGADSPGLALVASLAEFNFLVALLASIRLPTAAPGA